MPKVDLSILNNHQVFFFTFERVKIIIISYIALARHILHIVFIKTYNCACITVLLAN